jgi:hypothetical protein
MKRKRLPYREGYDNCESGQDTSLSLQLRVKNENIATGEERSIDGSVHILDLPIELLSTILHFTGK